MAEEAKYDAAAAGEATSKGEAASSGSYYPRPAASIRAVHGFTF